MSTDARLLNSDSESNSVTVGKFFVQPGTATGSDLYHLHASLHISPTDHRAEVLHFGQRSHAQPPNCKSWAKGLGLQQHPPEHHLRVHRIPADRSSKAPNRGASGGVGFCLNNQIHNYKDGVKAKELEQELHGPAS